ncbi:hypothetical protein BDF21DRAFT_423740 [Thamnidium elegans]|nr:hypothetical protein BDF21DRAFT_423740 [Thamnidium elegans]
MCQVPDYFYRLFKSVRTLEDYLGKSIDQCKTADQITLLQTLLIIKSNRDCDNFSRWQKFIANKKPPLPCIEPKRFPELSNVLDSLVFYMKKDWKVNNALSSGIDIISPFNVEVLSHKIENTVLNQMKDSEAWNSILSCLGEELFCKLLLDYIILQKLPNNTFYQVSGQLISTNLRLSKSTKQPKKEPKQIVQYKSAFLHDIKSNKSSLSEYLNKLISTKKRQRDKTTKTPRRVRKKLKMTKEKYYEFKNK